MRAIGSLFAGIGGFELGLEAAGVGRTAWQVEIDERSRAVLARHWPHTDRSVIDVREVPGAALAAVQVLCGGFPCQDLSQANPKGKGLEGPRSGLFWAFLDAIDALEPEVVAIENVSRLARRGLDVIGRELRQRGFEVEASRLRAADVGAPHRRERLFVLAFRPDVLADSVGQPAERRRISSDLGSQARQAPGARDQRQWDGAPARHRSAAVASPAVAVGHGGGCQELGRPSLGKDRAHPLGHEPLRCDGASSGGAAEMLGDALCNRLQGLDHARPEKGAADLPGSTWEVREAQSRLGGAPHGVSAWLDETRWPAGRGHPQADWEAPRLTGRTRSRRPRLRALGNAIVPQCARVVGDRIMQRTGWEHE